MKQKKIQNFGGFPKEFCQYDSSKIIILPIPFDKTSTWMKGADKGPKAIIDASPNLEFYDIETDSEVYKNGIFTAEEIDEKDSISMIKKVNESTKKFLDDEKFVVLIGGEHSISIGAINAFADHYKNIGILHLDAHSDRRESYEGSKYNHACVIARAQEVSSNIVSVGIRSMDSSELKNANKDSIFFAQDIHDSDSWIKDAVKKLPNNVYITIDLDVFDPSILPSTGTPEPGGMDWYSVLKLLKAVSDSKNIVGFDVVELCPSKVNKAPDFISAKLIYTLLSYKFCKKNEK
ncbi:MAG: agmatinase [archaeon]